MKHQTNSFGDIDYWLAEWLKSSRRQSINTHEAYRRDVGQFLTAVARPFDQVAVGDILEYQSSLSELAPKTQARKMAAVRSFYRFLNNREVTSLNLARIEAPRLQQQISRDKLLTEKEVQAIIQAATNDQHRLFVRFLYLTAVRVSEALALRWRDLTPLGDAAEAHITGKGNKHRDIFIPAPLYADLLAGKNPAYTNGVTSL
jgi:integrase/recombinase XerD